MEAGSRRAIVAALFANGGISVAKFVGFAFTGSASTEARVRAAVPEARVVSLEPDIARSGG